MDDTQFVDVKGTIELVDHHVCNVSPSIQSNSILDEYVDEMGNVVSNRCVCIG